MKFKMPNGQFLAKLGEFSLGELLLILRFAAEAPFSRLALRRAQQPLQAWISRTGNVAVDDSSIAKARRLGRIVNFAVSRSVGPENCLVRSLMLAKFLDKQGIPCCIRLGTLKSQPFSVAHAWVEVGGEVANDTAENIARFAEFRPRTNLSDGVTAA